MPPYSPVDVPDLQCKIEIFSKRFNSEAYRVVTQVAVAAAKVRAIAARKSSDDEPVDPNHIRTSVAATEGVVAQLAGIAASAGNLRRALDESVCEMIAAPKQTHGSVDSPRGSACNVNLLVHGVLLTREIDTLVADVAGLTNLLTMNLVIEPVHASRDLAAAASEVCMLAGRAAWTIEELAMEVARIHKSVTAVGQPVSLEPAGASTRMSAEIRAA